MSKEYTSHMSYTDKVRKAINGCFYSAWHNSSTNDDVPKDERALREGISNMPSMRDDFVRALIDLQSAKLEAGVELDTPRYIPE